MISAREIARESVEKARAGKDALIITVSYDEVRSYWSAVMEAGGKVRYWSRQGKQVSILEVYV